MAPEVDKTVIISSLLNTLSPQSMNTLRDANENLRPKHVIHTLHHHSSNKTQRTTSSQHTRRTRCLHTQTQSKRLFTMSIQIWPQWTKGDEKTGQITPLDRKQRRTSICILILCQTSCMGMGKRTEECC